MQTITVQNWNGEIEVTRDEFVQRWMDQVTGLWTICYNQADYEKAEIVRANLKSLAGNAFDTLYLEKMGAES